jgi:copper chaperone CopZ
VKGIDRVAPVEGRGLAVEIGKMPRRRIHVQIEGLLSVHAVRAVRTALAGVPGVLGAEVSMRGAVLDADADIAPALLHEALGHAGVQVLEIRTEKGSLPIV